MIEVRRRVHTAEMLAHMALFAAQPVWQWRFGRQIDEGAVVSLQSLVLRAPKPLPVREVEMQVERHLGRAGWDWMWMHFVSTARPRPELQAALVARILRPAVLPRQAARAGWGLVQALGPKHAALEAFERLLVALDARGPDPRDADLVRHARGLFVPDVPVLWLTHAMLGEVLGPVLVAEDAMRHSPRSAAQGLSADSPPPLPASPLEDALDAAAARFAVSAPGPLPDVLHRIGYRLFVWMLLGHGVPERVGACALADRYLEIADRGLFAEHALRWEQILRARQMRGPAKHRALDRLLARAEGTDPPGGEAPARPHTGAETLSGPQA